MSEFIKGISGKLVMSPAVLTGNKPVEENLDIVSGAPSNGNELQGPISAGTPISIPNSETYEDTDLQIFFNGQQIDVIGEYNYVGAGPIRTQIAFTFDLEAGDEITFRIDK
jgi:hypothetical protein